MKTLCILIFTSVLATAQQLPHVIMIGQQSENCLNAAKKALYIEARVGVVPKHTVNVYCTQGEYARTVEKLGLFVTEAPDSLSQLKARVTYLNSSSVLRTTGDYRHRGDFVIAHEIGHFATDSPLEWRADAWATQMLKKYVKISYEAFVSTKVSLK